MSIAELPAAQIPRFEIIEEPVGMFRLVTEDRCYLTFRTAWASPVSHPQRFLALLDGRDRQIMMIDDPSELPAELWAKIQEELDRRYLTTKVLGIDYAKTEFGITYWTLQTSRGRKEIVTQSLQENAQWMGPHHLMLLDVDGNRFEISDIRKLDPASQKRLLTTV
jgi:hypothetical protein